MIAKQVTMLLVALAGCLPTPSQAKPSAMPVYDLDAIAADAMTRSGAKGLAIAVTIPGKVDSLGAWGLRNANGDPLTTDTIMYSASLTKTAFTYAVLQMVREKRLTLDQPIAAMLPRPLPEYSDPQELYAPWNDLAGDPRWKAITPRMVFTHSTGFANFFWLNPDQKLMIHFAPGSRYAYSGDGMVLLQFGLERGLGLKLGEEMQARVFGRFGMTRTSMKWRDDFAANMADGWKADGSIEPHDHRDNVRAAGSMDTTIADIAAFSAGLLADSRALRAISRPSLPITSLSQFPSLLPEAPKEQRFAGLAAGLGVVTFTGPQGLGFFKGGHNDSTGNTMVCLLRPRRCVTILSNDVRAEAAFPTIVRSILGETGVPWRWEYGEQIWTGKP